MTRHDLAQAVGSEARRLDDASVPAPQVGKERIQVVDVRAIRPPPKLGK